MDLSLSDEQKQLQEAAERFVRDKYTFENRRKIVATERGWLPENWAQFAELGWLGMAFSEEDGGYGGGRKAVRVAGRPKWRDGRSCAQNGVDGKGNRWISGRSA